MNVSVAPAAPAAELNTLLTTQEVADRYRVPLNTVHAWRMRPGRGPRGMRVGKYVRYRLEDVLAWEESQLDPEGAA
jgi:hypothetical protein